LHRFIFPTNLSTKTSQVPEGGHSKKGQTTMFCKDKMFLRSVHLATALLMLMLATTALQAQTDPGARPVGTKPFNQFCPGIQGAKFPNAPACIDVDQPPDGKGNLGAGNVVTAQPQNGNLSGFWFQALTVFETKAVVGPEAQTGGATFPGLGPSFNGESCFQCHSQPAVGGSSPNKSTPGFPNGNPQIGDAPTSGQLTAVTTAPSGFSPILKADGSGPVREVRFPNGFAGDPTNFIDPVVAGTVANLFVIAGRPDDPPGCLIGQEPFQTEIQNHNVIFRIPIPTFGEGFVENTDDSELHNNATEAQTIAQTLGIHSIQFNNFNTSGNDQTITRFGWKAQNKSMLIFAGEASNVEMGVTNENFTNERTHGNGQCSPNFEPEDQVVVPPLNILNHPNLSDPRTIDGANGLFALFGAPGVVSDSSSNIENFAVFMRLNASPSQCNYNSGVIFNPDGTSSAQCKALDASAQRGAKLFGSVDPNVPGSLTSSQADNNPNTTGITPIGCVLCHSDFLTTTTSNTVELNFANFHPFSDFAIHTMDPQLADGVIQGAATSQQFRSAPLWGIGQRLFFMHDGRTDNLVSAIQDHCLPQPAGSTAPPSEACDVINKFNALPATTTCANPVGCPSRQDIINFLRSL
jgi:hypothetical protein